MIRVHNVSKSFGDDPALDGVDLVPQPGVIYGLVGPDGAGKSTLLRIMAGIMRPDQGFVDWQGEDIFKRPWQYKENIAYMPQRFGLYEDLSIEENIFFFGQLFGMRDRAIRQRLDSLYGFSGLGPFRKRLAGKLSGGMKQKLGLCCCLVHDPQLLLLDEPTNGVDPVSRREFWKILYSLLAGGVSMVVSTAYLDEAERCGTVGLMYKGKILREGTPADVRSSTGMNSYTFQAGKKTVDLEKKLRAHAEFASAARTGEVLSLLAKPEKETLLKKIAMTHEATLKRGVPTLEEALVHIIAGEVGEK